MAVSRLPQEHVETRGSLIDDTLSPPSHDGSSVDIADTLDYICSQIADITGETAWETSPDNTIAALEAKTALEDKLAHRWIQLLTDITVPNGQNYKVISVAGSEIPARPKAIAGTTKGLVTAEHGGSFGAAHSLAELAGKTTLLPQNLLRVWDGDTGDALESSGRQVFAVLQHESGATDGTNFTDTTPQRAQISFVRANSTHDDLEAVPVIDIEDKKVNIAWQDRIDLDSWAAQDFLSGVQHIDLGIAGAATTLDNAIDNQGTTPATQTTNIFWRIDDDTSLNFQTSDGARSLLSVLPAAAGDEVEINADTLDINVGASGTVDVDNGMTVDSGGTPLNLGVTAGQIDTGAAAITVKSTGATATVEGVGVNIAGGSGEIDATTTGAVDVNAGTTLALDSADTSNFTMAANDALNKELRIAARNAGAGEGNLYLEADDDVFFETAQETGGIALDDSTTGPISGTGTGGHTSVAAAIQDAYDNGGVAITTKRSALGSSYAAGVNMPAVTLDLTAFTLNMAADSNTMEVFLNGRLLDGATGTGLGDIYPGTTPASGDLKHDFPKPFKSGDILYTRGWA